MGIDSKTRNYALKHLFDKTIGWGKSQCQCGLIREKGRGMFSDTTYIQPDGTIGWIECSKNPGDTDEQ